MKILVQSDDFGFTKGVVDGMCDAFENGIITATGLFANMPEKIRNYAVEKMKQYPNICFGIDINVVSGPSVADPKLLPTLCNQETGCFIQTSERVNDPEWGKKEFKPYDEVFIEASAQVEKFIELLGRKPEYLTSHSSGGSKSYRDAIRDVAHKYGIPFSGDVFEKYGIKFMSIPYEGERYSIENQMKDKVDALIEILEANKEENYVNIPTHCGYVDDDLFKYTRCNIERAKDHALLTSDKVKKWIKDNNAELVSYRDLPL